MFVSAIGCRIMAAEARGHIKPGDTLIEATSGNTGIALAMVFHVPQSPHPPLPRGRAHAGCTTLREMLAASRQQSIQSKSPESSRTACVCSLLSSPPSTQCAAIRGYKLILTMPDNMTEERKATMRVYGAELISVPKAGGMELARDLADQMEREGKGRVLNQFGNFDNPDAHYLTTGPEIWDRTGGAVTHFVSSMVSPICQPLNAAHLRPEKECECHAITSEPREARAPCPGRSKPWPLMGPQTQGTTGTIMGTSRYLKEQSPAVQIVGVTPSEGSSIPGIRRWPKEYLPTIFEASRVDRMIEVTQHEAEDTGDVPPCIRTSACHA